MDLDAVLGAAARRSPCRRDRAHQRPRLPEPQALPGRARAARRRHQRHRRVQHPAPREPERPRRARHRRRGARDRARHASSSRPTRSSTSTSRSRTCSSGCRRARSTPPTRSPGRSSTSSGTRTSRRCASWRCARWPRASSAPRPARARGRAGRAAPSAGRVMVCTVVVPAARGGAAAPRLAHGRAAQHRLVRRLRRDAAGGARRASTPRPSATCSTTSRWRASSAPRSCASKANGSGRGAPRLRALARRRHIIIGRRTSRGGAASLRRVRDASGWSQRGGGLRRAHRLVRGGAASVTLRTKLLLAQAAARARARRWWAPRRSSGIATLGRSAERILADNYRSVLAAQRMRSPRRPSSTARVVRAVRRAARRRGRARADAAGRFEEELRVAGGATSPSRARPRPPRGSRARWTRVPARPALGPRGAPAPARPSAYFDELRARVAASCEGAGRRDPRHQPGRDAAQERAGRRDGRADDAPWSSRSSRRRSLAGLLASVCADRRACCGRSRPCRQAVRRIGEGDLDARAPTGGRGRDRRARRASSTRWRSASSSTAELARRAAAGAAGLAGGHRQPARPGRRLRRRRARPQRERRRGGAARRARGASRDPLAALDPELRAALERVRAHVLGGQGPLRAPRASTRRCGSSGAEGERYLLPRATPLYARGGRHHRRDDRPPGRDPPASLRRAQERPGRHRGARVPHAAHLAAHGDPPLPRGGRRAAHREAGRPPLRGARGLRAAAGDRRRPARPLAHPVRADRAAPAAGVAARRARRRPPSSAPRARRPQGSRSSGVAREHLPERRASIPSGIQLVLANLLGNAIRHTPAGRRVIERAAAEGEGAVRFEVSDTGPGIPPEYQRARSSRSSSGCPARRRAARASGSSSPGRSSRRTAARSASRASPGRAPLLVHAAARRRVEREAARRPPRARRFTAPYFLRLRQSVEASMPRIRAASSSVRRVRHHPQDVLALDLLEREVAAERGRRAGVRRDPLGERLAARGPGRARG